MTDTYVPPPDGYVEPDETGKDGLRKFIRQYVWDHGGCVNDVHAVAKACHLQFPGVFKWSEIEVQMERVQTRWNEQRAAAEAAANPSVEPPVVP
jgi:hypothetical protein